MGKASAIKLTYASSNLANIGNQEVQVLSFLQLQI